MAQKDILERIRELDSPLIMEKHISDLVNDASREIISLRERLSSGTCGVPKPVAKVRIKGIWENDYVRRLGIADHCSELLTITDELRVQKGFRHGGDEETHNRRIVGLQRARDNECMDLLLILEKWGDSHAELRAQRTAKFEENEKNAG